MAVEDEEVRPVLATVALERMGVAELKRYVDALKAEIVRAEAQLEAKQDHRSAADDLFKF